MIINPLAAYSKDRMSAIPTVTFSDTKHLTVNNVIKYTGQIYAIAMSIQLPDKALFVSSKTQTKPVLQPQNGDAGLLEFIWITPPKSPFNLIYTVNHEKATGDIQSKIIYRRKGGTVFCYLKPVMLNTDVNR